VLKPGEAVVFPGKVSHGMTLLGETKTLSYTKEERPSNKGEKIYPKGKKNGGGYFFLDTV